ncbi:helix-turn-helix domain-containing protein [Akkermansiaceae bacterium]|jgi:excisionase family DNA binding protein|nr:helix-turn-helix domain-containing protein [bacterium]MDA7907317.1 helix-turn-helix domain-containing protein [Akkermansiaceae bacterium]MDB4509420.1 helix-turn-helix domain-containing protein [Akkermansiaceae bacterium]
MSNITNYQGHESGSIQGEKESLITKKEAAGRLAISTRTLDRLVAQGLIEKIFVGSSVRFKEREVAAVVERGI